MRTGVRPYGRGFSVDAVAGDRLSSALPAWMTLTRGAGSWSRQSAIALDGTTFIVLGTAVNTARFSYCAAAGRLGLLIEPTRTNHVVASDFVDAGPNNVPDGWNLNAGVAGVDSLVVAGAPHGGVLVRLADTAVANRGYFHSVATMAALTTYSSSAWVRRTVAAGAGEQILAHERTPGLAGILLNAALHDWLVTFTATATVGVPANLYVLCAFNDPQGVIEVACPQIEAGIYPTSRILAAGAGATRAAELCTLNATTLASTAQHGYWRALVSPQFASTTALAGAWTLKEWAPGWRIDFDPADDKIKVFVNTVQCATTAALTFSAGDLLDISLRYSSGGHTVRVNGVDVTDGTNWGNPGGAFAPFLGSRAASANCEAAIYMDVMETD